jgi:hypothetical protein
MWLTHIYARTPVRALLQLTGDVLLVVWVVVWWRVGQFVEETVLKLAEPGRQIDQGAGDIASSLRDAGDKAGNVPLVGDELAGPFGSAGDAADAVAAAGRRQVEVVGDLASLLMVVVVVVPVVVALGLWLPGRMRFVRRAAAAQRFIDADADLALFALRAMANQPMHKLARISHDPVSAWRTGDAAVVRALASLELRDVGLRAPSR